MADGAGGAGGTVSIGVNFVADTTQMMNDLKEFVDKLTKYMVDHINKQVNDIDLSGQAVQTPEKDKQKKEEDERTQKLLGSTAAATDKMANAGISIVKGTFELVENIYERLKKSSPLLEAVERLFNLAWMLFFMPLGNKLAEVLIPAVINLMDSVMDIWDSFEGQTLGQMFATAIREGVVILGEFLISIGEQLAEESGLVGAIGKMLTTVGNFIENKGEQLLTALTTFAGWVLTHLRELLALIIGFRIMSTALQMTQIMVTAASGGFLGTGIGIGTAIAGLGAIAIGSYAAGDAVVRSIGLAEGGYVPATPGGHLAIIGEGGEGEYVIPESKMGSVGGSNYTINIYSYSTDELKRVIKDVVSGEISKSRLRSGWRWQPSITTSATRSAICRSGSVTLGQGPYQV